MFLSVLVMLVEAVFCNLIYQPKGYTDMEAIEVVFLAVNVAVTILSVRLSIKDKNAGAVRFMIAVSLLLRTAIMLWDIYGRDVFVLPNSEGDAVWYKSSSASYAFYSRASLKDYNEYSFYVGQLYKFIGIQDITAQFINVFLAIVSIVLLYKILCMFDVSEKNKTLAIGLACFLPNSMMISSFFLQESVIAFFIVLSVYLYSKWWTSGYTLYFILALIPPALGSFLHSGSIVPAIAIVGTYAFVGNSERKLRVTALASIGAVAFSLVMLWYMSSNSGMLFSKIGGTLSADSVVSHAGLTDTVTDADYFIGIKGLPSSLDLIVNSPIRMLYFICSPVPWMWRSFEDIIAFGGSALFYIIVFVYAVRTIKKQKLVRFSNKNNELFAFFFVVLIMILFATLMFGWGVSNSGTALRHREKFTDIFVLMFAVTKELLDRLEARFNEKDISNSSGLQRRKVSKQMHHYYR